MEYFTAILNDNGVESRFLTQKLVKKANKA